MTDEPTAAAAPRPGRGGGLRDAFRRAFRGHPSGVAVVTAMTAEGPVAVTVSSLISISDSPPTLAFSVSAASRSGALLPGAGSVVVHFLQKKDIALGRLCAEPDRDRFADPALWETLPTGEPRARSVATWFRARVVGSLAVNGAVLVAAELLEGEAPAADPDTALALVYLNRRWHGLLPGPG